MSYGTRKAIGGMLSRQRKTDTRVEESVRRFDACTTVAEVREVLAWAKGEDWFLRTEEQDARMRAAFDRARQRCQP